jgi:ribosome-associated toxin RatA of RatAB toxin-antitoxin module
MKKFFSLFYIFSSLFPHTTAIANYAQKVAIQQKSNQTEPYLTGSEGEYTVSIAVKGDRDIAWGLLTDYDHFANYMPNVVESQLLEVKDNQKIFTQVQVFNVLVFPIKAKVKIKVTEHYPDGLEFQVIEGNVKHLHGSWKIQQMTTEEFLITHQVSVQPQLESEDLRSMFFSIYEDTLRKTVQVIQQETEKRSHN